jgi:hypothetical protein
MPELEHIACPRELILSHADHPLSHIVFPDSGVISVVAVYADGSIIEMVEDAGLIERCRGASHDPGSQGSR